MEWKLKFERPLSPRRPRSPSSVSSSSSSASNSPLLSFSSDAGDSFVSAEDCFEEDEREISVSSKEAIAGRYGRRSAVQFVVATIILAWWRRKPRDYLPYVPGSNLGVEAYVNVLQKEILIKVEMNGDKCRTKAMKLIETTQGVHSVSIDGEEKDRFLVTGDNIDCVKLTRALRKKVGNGLTRTLRKKEGYADIVSVKEVKKEEPKKEEAAKEGGSCQ